MIRRYLSCILIALSLAACGVEASHAASKAAPVEFLLSQVRASGVALSGGKVYFYAVGTTTAKTVWTDRAKTTPAANPYTLDANGTALVYGDGLYRIVIKDAAGVTKYDRDNLSFKDPSGYYYDMWDYANLSAAVAAIGSTPATLQISADITLTGNVTIPPTMELMPVNGAKINLAGYTLTCSQWQTSRWPQAQIFAGSGSVTNLTEAIPQWWGAKGDGSTTDSAAINKALAAAKAVYLPVTANSYVIDGADPVDPNSNNTLYSNGAWLKLKAGTYATTAHVIHTVPGQDGSYNGAVAVTENINIRGINIDGNIANVTGSGTAINLYRVLNARVTDFNIKDMPGTTGGGYGIISNYSNRVWIERGTINRTDRQNIAIWETQPAYIDNVVLENSYLRDCILVSDLLSSTTPVALQTSFATITNSKLTNTSATGTHVVRFSGGGSGTITDCEITSNDNLQGVYVVSTAAATQGTVHIARNKITNCSKGVEVDIKDDRYISIDDNDIIGSVDGIRYEGFGTVKVTNNRTTGTTTQPLNIITAKTKIVDNNVFVGGSSPVVVESYLTGSTIITDNIIRDLTSASYSLLVTGTATSKPLISGNVLENNTANTINSTVAAVIVNNPGATIAASLAYVNVLNTYRTTYGAAIPTSGTWGNKDRVIRDPAAAGQPKAWVCTVAGTAGTLNGGATVADTTATSAVIVVSSVTGLNVGDYVTVAGIGGTTTKRIVSISGFEVTVDTAATNTVAAGAMSYVNPTFVSEGNL